jgi:hypothetical protein
MGVVFKKVKDMLPVSGDDYDGQIIAQINAAVADLTKTAEIVLPGNVSISQDSGTKVVSDNSTLEDDYVITAIATWCNMRIGNPPNYDNLLKAYEAMKGAMRLSNHYTVYGEVTAG